MEYGKNLWVKKHKTATAQLVLEKFLEKVKESGCNTVMIDETIVFRQHEQNISLCQFYTEW